MDQNGIGHSWGLAALTSSEVKGAQFDQIHSLAGAGMPSQWEADPATDYKHWAYTDILTMAQETGLVWDGNVPANSSAFESAVYERDGDFDLYLPSTAPPGGVSVPHTTPPSIPSSTSAFDNHNLIASDRDENHAALRDILREMQK